MVQSSKVRPIDNYSESQVNDAATITNKCTVDGVDTIAAMASTFVKSLKESGRGGTIQGRAFDLKAAYRQLAVRDECLKWATLTPKILCASNSIQCLSVHVQAWWRS